MNRQPTKVLLVEDESSYIELLEVVLKDCPSRQFDLKAARSVEEGVEQLSAHKYDVILLDLSLPDEQGLATYTRIHAAAPSTPIVVLSGIDDQNLALHAVRDGAQDYLVKGQVDARILIRVIEYAIERKKTVEQLRNALAELRKSHEELKEAQQQLVQSEKLEAISTFAAGVAHEVKNPLQTIILGVDYLSGHFSADKSATTVLNDMAGAVHRADAIIRGLLEFSGNKRRDVKDEDLTNIVEQSLHSVENELSVLPVALEKDLASNLPPLKLDFRTMKHVFINLFLYSIRGMAQGGTLRVRTYVKEIQENVMVHGRVSEHLRIGDTVVVAEVEDTAPSLSNSNPVPDSAKGGKDPALGVKVLKKIVELYGGFVDLTSGAGNRYTLSFKAASRGS